MSAPVSLLLDPGMVRIIARDGSTLSEIAWSPDAPDVMIDAIRDQIGAPSAIVVVVGLGLLEIAQPELPPLTADARRTVLWRDADRYFPLDESVAVVCVDQFALAVPARRLASWVRAIGMLGPVRAIVTTPQLCVSALDAGTYAVTAGDNEDGVVEVRDGRLRAVRRAPLDRSDAPTASARGDGVKNADVQRMGRDAGQWHDAPLTEQLLDATLAAEFRRSRQRRLVTSVLLAAASVLFLVWSADRWRGATLSSLEAQAAELATRAEPAMRAESRRERAQAELILVTASDAAQRAPDAPLAVLAQLSRILPSDAFVQRLEWDGQRWRVEGTADNARRLVPLLDGDAHFRDVRIASASQRFLDAGRQRESFAIGFRMRPVTGGADGTR